MTHNRSTDAARDPWRESLHASRERRAGARRARQWSFRRRAVAFGACAAMALGGGVAAAGTGGTSAAGSGGSATTDGETDGAAASTLRPGVSGPAVKRLQRKLRVRATGYYGPLTRRAVQRFQRRAGLTADGIAGPETLARLGIRMPAADAPSSEATVRVPAILQRIAQCESGGNPRAVSPDGRYRGKYQFSMDTWRAMGGTGDPAEAPEAEQDRLAVKLYRQRGTAPWPTCANA